MNRAQSQGCQPVHTRPMSRAAVLVIDDEVSFLDYLLGVLRGAGYQAQAARCAEEALGTIAAAAPDLVMCDIAMPGINGFQLCRRLKASPATQHSQVVLMTGRPDPVTRFWARETGAAAVISKTIERAVLLTQVANLLDGRGKSRADSRRDNSVGKSRTRT